MNGCTSKNWISTPISSPMMAPPISMAGITSQAGTPSLSIRAPMIAVKASTAPTERSMPAVRMTKVMPTARISRYALSSSSDDSTRGVRKLPK